MSEPLDDTTDVLVVHKTNDAWADGFVDQLRRAGARVERIATVEAEGGGLQTNLLDHLRRAAVAVISPGLSEGWAGMLAGMRASVHGEPPVMVDGETARRIAALPGSGHTGAVEVVHPTAILQGISRRLGLHEAVEDDLQTLPFRGPPLLGEPHAGIEGRLLGSGECVRSMHLTPGAASPCAHGRSSAWGGCEAKRAVLAVATLRDDALAAYMERNHRDNHGMDDPKGGFEAALAARGAALLGILAYGTSGRVARAAGDMLATRAARAERLRNYRLGVEPEEPTCGRVAVKIWQNPDLGALFAGDPLMPDPCDETLGWTQLGTASFWLSALQHRTLPALLEHLRQPEVIPGRAWGQRVRTIFDGRARRVDETLAEIVSLYPPRSEGEVISWIGLVQRKLHTRMQHAILDGMRDWPGVDARLVQALAHGIGREEPGWGGNNYVRWAHGLAAARDQQAPGTPATRAGNGPRRAQSG